MRWSEIVFILIYALVLIGPGLIGWFLARKGWWALWVLLALAILAGAGISAFVGMTSNGVEYEALGYFMITFLGFLPALVSLLLGAGIAWFQARRA